MNRYRPASGPVAFDVTMSQAPEFEFGTRSFWVLRSATVRWLHFELERVIGVASSGLSTANGRADEVRGVKDENLVLTARAGSPTRNVRAMASFTLFDMDASPNGYSE